MNNLVKFGTMILEIEIFAVLLYTHIEYFTLKCDIDLEDVTLIYITFEGLNLRIILA